MALRVGKPLDGILVTSRWGPGNRSSGSTDPRVTWRVPFERLPQENMVQLHDLLKSGGFLVHRPGAVILLHGPFRPAAAPPEDGPALYAPDFFLDDPSPWRVPTGWEEAGLDAFRAAWPAPPDAAPALDWREPDRAAYAGDFADLMLRIESGELAKTVPIAFAAATCPDPRTALLIRLVRGALDVAPASVPFGYWDAAGGIVGATPEILFDRSGSEVRTMALAGTAEPHEAAHTLASSKERAEHRIVVDEMVAALGRFGTVECGPVETVLVPHLAHLKAEIRLTGARPSFLELVQALHPTPALGGAPVAAALAWLRGRDRGVNRGAFGAPFGIRGVGEADRCVVAIRCIQWAGNEVRLATGGGVVAGSRLDAEWSELARKRRAVREMLLS